MSERSAMVHHGEAIRLMSGEYGTCVVEDGDKYPPWYPPVETSSDTMGATTPDKREEDN